MESQLELEILSQQAEIDRLRTLLTARDLQAAEVDEEAKHAVPLQQEVLIVILLWSPLVLASLLLKTAVPCIVFFSLPDRAAPELQSHGGGNAS